MINSKTFWRKLFQEFYIGDRVSIPDYARKGFVTKKVWVLGDLFSPIPHWVYEITFDHAMRLDSRFFPKGKRLVKSFEGMRYVDCKFIR